MGIFDVFSTDAAEKGAAKLKAGINAGKKEAYGYFGQGRDALSDNYATAAMQGAGLLEGAQRSFGLAGDLTGAGGAEGQARAAGLFQTDPGYNFARDEALQGVERSAFARGGGLSGNTAIALQDRAGEVANRGYNDWANRAMTMAGYAPGLAQTQAGVYTGLGTGLANSWGQQGQLGYGAEVAKGEADKAAELDAIRASGQFWNTALGAANLGAKLSGVGGFAPGGRA